MLEDFWHIACPSKELKSKPHAVTIFAQHLVLSRNSNGQPFALEDRCAHRNMPLHCGKSIGDGIQCPYHGWQYDDQGKVTHIPANPNQEQEHPKYAIKAFPCTEQDGYIWVCLTDNPATSEPPKFPYLNESGWTTFRMTTKFNATVENCLENFLDVPHATFVHKKWFRSPNAKTIEAIVTTSEDGAVAEYINEPRKRSLVFSLLSKSSTQLKHTDRYIAPSMSRVDYQFSDHRHYIISSFCTPINDSQTQVFTVITFKFSYLGWFVRLFFEPLSRLIIKQDVDTLNKQQANIEKFGEQNFSHITQDLLRPHIISWRNALAQNKVKKFKPSTKKVKLRV